ncbi:hypothetical protein [Pseudomonas denitrificans (nom. rej.)]|uniref:DUF1484 family protein n=1 Tax=Pseudomonas denitrificans TaxID=43306 RepID=A0A9X7R6Y7_PSEDE|nr:hypothetical protein [Pseudomonas denitrificans (nom. rej.)]QEY75098.1 hypothetical protein F1C79_27665 [Pseudomonas denitrificans (nom. rej.)]
MTNSVVARLSALHSRLAPLVDVDQQLPDLTCITAALARLDDVVLSLNRLSGALELLLELLDAAHARRLSGEQLHCLLEPLANKLQGTLEVLDDLL